MGQRRVVITGLGTVNPLGNNVKDTWEKIINGKSGIGPITRFDASHLNCRIAGEVKDFDYKELYTEEILKKAKRMDPYCHYALAAAKQAIEHACLDNGNNKERTGICVGSGIGGINVQHQNSSLLVTKGPRRISPFYIPFSIGNMASGLLGIILGYKGPNLSIQTACATGNHSIAVSMMTIKNNMADVMITGGTESTITELAVAGFANMQALSKRNESPETASRPFDVNRDGFVMSEGAAVLVLEEYEHARKRGADIICEVLSCGMSGDAYDFVAPDPEGYGAYLSMKMALDQAGKNPDELDYLNTHGTSTPPGDIAEGKGIYQLIKDKQEKICIGSTKSMHGHLLGATAGLEAIITAMAIKEGKIPANINIENFDEEIPLTSVNREVVEKPVKLALSNSFGFGGHNSSLLLSAI